MVRTRKKDLTFFGRALIMAQVPPKEIVVALLLARARQNCQATAWSLGPGRRQVGSWPRVVPRGTFHARPSRKARRRRVVPQKARRFSS